MAKQMGISATPGTGGIQAAGKRRLIEIIPYRGAVVKELDQREIEEAYACREALEHLAVEQVIERVSQEEIDKLYRMIEEFEQTEGVAEIARASQQFDDQIYQLTGNRILKNLLEMLKGVISRDRKYSAGSPERKHEICEEHRAIVDALAKRDVGAARRGSVHPYP